MFSDCSLKATEQLCFCFCLILQFPQEIIFEIVKLICVSCFCVQIFLRSEKVDTHREGFGREKTVQL